MPIGGFRFSVVIAAGILALGFGIARGADKFKQECDSPHYPSPEPSQKLGIEAKCGVEGSGGDNAEQNRVKNNFCATGKPLPIALDDFKELQKKAGDNTDTADRGRYGKLGEGQQRTFIGYVLLARQEGAESVNCGKNVTENVSQKKTLFHDIHISLVETAKTRSECSGIVVEMSPHHRPDAWTAGNVNKVKSKKAQVRVTGQLFFDASHRPCQAGKPIKGQPKRVSVWEIHPVYTFEVCSVGKCDDAEDKWQPLDEWVKAQKNKKKS